MGEYIFTVSLSDLQVLRLKDSDGIVTEMDIRKVDAATRSDGPLSGLKQEHKDSLRKFVDGVTELTRSGFPLAVEFTLPLDPETRQPK